MAKKNGLAMNVFSAVALFVTRLKIFIRGQINRYLSEYNLPFMHQ